MPPAVIASNYLVTLVKLADEFMGDIRYPPGSRQLRPYYRFEGHPQQYRTAGIPQALTGQLPAAILKP